MTAPPRSALRLASLLILVLALFSCGRAGNTPPAELRVDTSELKFEARPGDVVSAQTLSLSAPEDESVAWRAAASAPWIVFGPKEGTTPSTISVTVTGTGVLPGVHRGIISFSCDGEATSDGVEGGGAVVRVSIVLRLHAPGWTSADGPWGGRISSIAADGNGERVLAGDTFGAVWISDDGGASFRRGHDIDGESTNSEINNIYLNGASKVAWLSSDVVGVWRSQDAGEHWTRTSYAGGVHQLVVAADDTTAYIVSIARNAMLRTTDAGETWATFFSGEIDSVGVGAPARPGEVYYGESPELFRSVDGGQSWTNLAIPSMAATIMMRYGESIYVGGRDSRTDRPTLIRSQDDAATWENVSSGMPAMVVHDLELTTSGFVLAGSSGLFSSESGSVWAPHEGGSGWATQEFLGIEALGDEVVAAHAVHGIVKEAGEDFIAAENVFAHEVVDLNVHPANGDVIAVTNRSGLWMAGSTGIWSPVADPSLHENERLAGSGKQLARDPSNPERLLLGRCDGGLLESLDNGTTWEALAAGAPGCVLDLAFAPDDAGRAYLAGSHAIFVSDDGGRTFAKRTDLHNGATSIVALAGDRVAYYQVCGTAVLEDRDGTALVSQNGIGDCWGPTTFAAQADGSLWVGASAGIWHKAASQSSFELRLANSGFPVTGIVFSGSRVWVGLDGMGLRYSDDEGATWHNGECPSLHVTALASDSINGGLWVATRDLGVLRLTLD